MSVKVMIPTPLRTHAEGKATAEVAAKTVAEALGHLTEQFGEYSVFETGKYGDSGWRHDQHNSIDRRRSADFGDDGCGKIEQ
jgi:hypothetical protein